MIRKTVIFMHRTLDRIVIIVSLIFFLICFYAMYDAYMVYYGATDSNLLKYKINPGDNPAVLKQLSEDAVAWLTVDDTNIDYPIMQGKDESEYINKNPYGEYSLSGSIFLDSHCDGKFRDPYSLIYGHHMDYGAMFGALDDFIDYDYFNSHRTGTLSVVDGKSYTISFFSAIKAPANEKLIFDPVSSENEGLLEYLKNNAEIYERPQQGARSRIIALSTCQEADTIERMILFGVIKETQK